jgi:hypothetical protein
MGWKFESGIVTTTHTPINSFVRRIYYATYEKGYIRRTIMASFVYTKIETLDKDQFIETLIEDPANLHLEHMDENLKIVEHSCSVGSITEFDTKELSQLPQDPREIEDIYETMTDDSDDNENQYWTRKHFEKYLGICDVSECVCTITEDEESKRRIREIIGSEAAVFQQSTRDYAISMIEKMKEYDDQPTSTDDQPTSTDDQPTETDDQPTETDDSS